MKTTEELRDEYYDHVAKCDNCNYDKDCPCSFAPDDVTNHACNCVFGFGGKLSVKYRDAVNADRMNEERVKLIARLHKRSDKFSEDDFVWVSTDYMRNLWNIGKDRVIDNFAKPVASCNLSVQGEFDIKLIVASGFNKSFIGCEEARKYAMESVLSVLNNTEV